MVMAGSACPGRDLLFGDCLCLQGPYRAGTETRLFPGGLRDTRRRQKPDFQPTDTLRTEITISSSQDPSAAPHTQQNAIREPLFHARPALEQAAVQELSRGCRSRV